MVRSDHLGGSDFGLGKLVLDIKLADGFYLIAEEIDAERIVVAVAVDVHDAASHGKLTWLEHKIHTLEAEVDKSGAERRDLYLLVDAEAETALLQLFGRRRRFGYRFGISDDDESLVVGR